MLLLASDWELISAYKKHQIENEEDLIGEIFNSSIINLDNKLRSIGYRVPEGYEREEWQPLTFELMEAIIVR